MREIVIVIRDLYLEPQLNAPSGTDVAALTVAPGIEQLGRLGDKMPLPEGWRAWVTRWLGLPQYADAAPASVAAAVLDGMEADGAVWLATPVHLIAGMTSLHFDRRSVLRLSDADLEKLAASFRDTFQGSGFELRPLCGGELLLTGPQLSPPATAIEPARLLLTSVAEALARGGGARALRQLGAEIEMWLHAHAVNDERARRGAPLVTSLWLWGGGAAAVLQPTARSGEIMDPAFGSDAYLRGLWRLAGGETRPMPVDWTAVLGEPRAQRALGVVEVAELLHANASWRLADAMTDIDRRLIAPSVAALQRGDLERLVLLANDRLLSVRHTDRWRLWRRLRAARGGLESLV